MDTRNSPLKTEAFVSPLDILQAVEERGGYDVYLLDILMPHVSGIDVARKVRDLVTVESFNHSRFCTLADGTEMETPATLSSLYEQLREYPGFFIPHRAYIVNLDYVDGLTAAELLLTDGRRIPISRNIYPKLKQAYMDYAF